jgi:hypothetical protein
MPRAANGEPQRAPSPATDVCPLCGGKLVNVGNVPDDPAKPSLNLAVWNRSSCDNLLHGNDSVICTQCRHAYSTLMQRWERSSEMPDSFQRPLGEAICRFPLPPAKDIRSRVVYTQTWTPTQMTESVGFWCVHSPDLISAFRSYARQHDLSLRTQGWGEDPSQVFVVVEANAKAEPGAAADGGA